MSPPSPTPLQPNSESSSALGMPAHMWSSVPPSSTAVLSPAREELVCKGGEDEEMRADDDVDGVDVDTSKHEKSGTRRKRRSQLRRTRTSRRLCRTRTRRRAHCIMPRTRPGAQRAVQQDPQAADGRHEGSTMRLNAPRPRLPLVQYPPRGKRPPALPPARPGQHDNAPGARARAYDVLVGDKFRRDPYTQRCQRRDLAGHGELRFTHHGSCARAVGSPRA
ncbi:hypothetical protein K438DRAFT_332366 [Mycena galopus ATCC 62051]|nr:hypothetical protein K438DRAFT_332366 [Mycena galopus ATCC 62051]